MMKDVGMAIMLKRKELGITIQQLSDKTGISITTLSQIENGKRTRKPQFYTLYKIADALEMDVNELIGK